MTSFYEQNSSGNFPCSTASMSSLHKIYHASCLVSEKEVTRLASSLKFIPTQQSDFTLRHKIIKYMRGQEQYCM